MCTLFPSACSMALQTVVVRGSEDAVEGASNSCTFCRLQTLQLWYNDGGESKHLNWQLLRFHVGCFGVQVLKPWSSRQ